MLRLRASRKKTTEGMFRLMFFSCILPLQQVQPLSNSDYLSLFPAPTSRLRTLAGNEVCRYALGGAARSTQPASLPRSYYEWLSNTNAKIEAGSPCFFFYNPHRYPAFMKGIRSICQESSLRKDLFIISGGTDRSSTSMEQRLSDSLLKCGNDYLDMFILEYVCPYELSKGEDNSLFIESGSELDLAIQQAQKWKRDGLVRYVGASAHSHRAGAALASHTGVDTLMLRYSMSHKDAAETISFPACQSNDKPVLAFCTTRWNKLQEGHRGWTKKSPTTGDCLSFALSSAHPPVEILLHSARDETELFAALEGLRAEMSEEETRNWEDFGDLAWNEDEFDEYPDERNITWGCR